MGIRRSSKREQRSRMALGAHVALVLVVAVASAAAIGAALWWLLGYPPLRQAGSWTTANSFEFAKIVLALIGGMGAVVALVIAYRKQHLGEAAEQREDIKLFAERFTKASDQLGSDKAPVRLAGMYAITDGPQWCGPRLCPRFIARTGMSGVAATVAAIPITISPRSQLVTSVSEVVAGPGHNGA